VEVLLGGGDLRVAHPVMVRVLPTHKDAAGDLGRFTRLGPLAIVGGENGRIRLISARKVLPEVTHWRKPNAQRASLLAVRAASVRCRSHLVSERPARMVGITPPQVRGCSPAQTPAGSSDLQVPLFDD
jgi:hypothetical protein